MKRFRPFAVLIALLTSISVLAQAGECPDLVKQALTQVGDNCAGLERNNACYGFNRVSVTFSQDVPTNAFSQPKDQAGLGELASVETAGLNTALNEWGVAVFSAQANIPGTLPGQSVKFLLLGDVSINNAVTNPTAQTTTNPVSLTTTADANIRSLPTTRANVVGSVLTGTTLTADAASQDGQWLRVIYNQTTPGWINREVVQNAGDLGGLPKISADSQTPMQAFTFRTGIGSPACNQSPSALVIQGPQKLAVNITANGVNINIGSTVALRTTDHGTLQITTISGEIHVGGLTIPRGFTTEAKLSPDGKTIIGVFSYPRPLTESELEDIQWLEDIPTSVLNYPIILPTEEELQQYLRSLQLKQPASQVDCSRFRPTSPLDGMNYGQQTFYWDAAPGATSYRVTVVGVGTAEVDAPTTNLTFDVGHGGAPFQATWYVEALLDGAVACTTSQVNIPRAAPPAPQMGDFKASWFCSGFSGEVTVSFSGAPPGTTSVTISFIGDSSPPTPFVVAGSSGSQTFLTSEGASNGTVTANPSGKTINLSPNDLFCFAS
jgi:hypothetical protein